MPNAVQKIARQFVKRLRRATFSTSSPPTGPNPDDVINGEEPSDRTTNLTELNQEADHGSRNASASTGECSSLRSSSSCEDCESRNKPILDDDEENDDDGDLEDDVIGEMETIKSLRIEDALIESKRMQEMHEKKSKEVNTRRLMKELRLLRKASEESDGAFEVEPCSNEEEEWDLSEWEARFYKFDESSILWKSMQEHQIDCVRFRITFPSDFPFSPPFVRLVSPYIENGFVMNGGAICLEVLTMQGWSSAYTVEALLVQVAAALAHGGAVVSKHQKRKQHKLTQKRAEAEFRRIIKIHNKYGWVKLDKDEG